MTWLLDTNVCIRYLQGRFASVRQEIQARSPGEIIVCSIVRAELFYGAMKSDYPAMSLAKQRAFVERFPSLAFDDDAALVFGRIRADLQRQGKPIGPYDLQIAAIALAHGLTLVTHNTREFSRIEGLSLADWEN
jgi:tRNA(fMet)-specific endonuclease VapC